MPNENNTLKNPIATYSVDLPPEWKTIIVLHLEYVNWPTLPVVYYYGMFIDCSGLGNT